MKKGLLLLFVLLGAIGLRAQDAVIVGDTLLAPSDTTNLIVGNTYIYGARSVQYPVRFIAEEDGYLTLTPSQKVSISSAKRNGLSIQAGGSMNYTDADQVKHTLDYYGAYTKETNNGISGIAMKKGDVFECKTYTSLTPSAENTISLAVSFTAGVSPLTFVGSLPENGSVWSGAMAYKSYGVKGAIYCSFSSLINPETVKATVKVGEKEYANVEVAVETYYSYMYVEGLADTLKVAAAEGLIAEGDEFTVTLTGLQDKIFPGVTLEDQTLTFVMGGTSCTNVEPAAATNLSIDKIETVVFSFDGKVNIDKAKFYLLNLADSSKIDLTATVEGLDVVIPVASAIEGMLPRLFDVVAEGVVDANGEALSFSTNAKDVEEGKLKAHYGMGLSYFAPVAVPAENDTVLSLKTFTFTYPMEVVYNASAVSNPEIKITQNWGEDVITTGTLTVSETDAKVVTITLAEEIKTPGTYRLEVPAKLIWGQDAGYNADDLTSKGSSKYGYYQSSINWNFYITPFEPTEVSPVSGSTVNKLDVITLTFPEEVDVNDDLSAALVSAEMGVAPDTLAVGEISYDYNDYTKVIVTLDKAIDSLGEYRLIVPAGAVFAVADETRMIETLDYNYNVDPDYWNPEWIVEVGANCTKEAPCELFAGRKYKFSEMYSYATFTAEKTGRLYFEYLEGSSNSNRQMDDEWSMVKDFTRTDDSKLVWLGVQEGKSYNIWVYGFGERVVKVTLEEGTPYEALTLTETYPAAGENFDVTETNSKTWMEGEVAFVFNGIALDKELLKAYLTIGENKVDVTEYIRLTNSYCAVALAEVPELQALKTGDKFAVSLENVQDANFPENKLAEGASVELVYVIAPDSFNPLTVTPEDENVVTSLKEIKLEFADKVNIANPEGVKVTDFNYTMDVTATLSIDATDEKVAVITFPEEITAPSHYTIEIAEGTFYNSAYNAEAEDKGLSAGAFYNAEKYLMYTILPEVSATTVMDIAPAPGGGWFATPLSKLPNEVVITFEGNVKKVVSASGRPSLWGFDLTEDNTEEVDNYSLAYVLNENVLTLTIPAKDIASVVSGSYVISIEAIGEDGKPIAYNMNDEFATNIQFSYSVMKMLEVVETVPAADATVKQLDKIVLTFDEEIEVEESNINIEDFGYQIQVFDENDEATVANYEISGNQVIVTLPEAITTNGGYALLVPEGMFYSVSYLTNGEIYYYYEVDSELVEGLAIVESTPENGSAQEALTQVTFTLNQEVGYLDHSMLVGSDGEEAHSASMTQSADDPKTYTLDFTFDGFYENILLKKGLTYAMTLSAYSSEEAMNYNTEEPQVVTLTFVGDSEGYVYSEVTLVGLTPTAGSTIFTVDENQFVAKFSAPVDMVEELCYINLGEGETAPYESIVANADKTEYTLTVAKNLMAQMTTSVNIIFAANDAEGKRVQGTSGEGKFSCFSISYQSLIGVPIPALEVTPANEAEIAELETITIYCEKGISPTWMGTIKLVDAEGNEIAISEPESVIPDSEADNWDYIPTTYTIALDETLTKVGTYTLTIPASYFFIGSDFINSKKTVVTFSITAEAQGINGVNITADKDVIVYNVAGVPVAQGKASQVLKNLSKGIYIVNGKKFIVK